MTTEIKVSDVERLRRSLKDASDGDVRFTATLPVETAQKLLTLLSEERKAGAVVIPAHNEFRTTEAAAILGVSRPHLSRLINSHKIQARRVGKHWRIPAEAIIAFQETERADAVSRLDELMEVSNEVGFFD